MGGWVEAGQLEPGDHLRAASGMDTRVVKLRRDVGHAAVYTLTVAHTHTFFVGQARVLVHNASCNIFVTFGKNELSHIRAHWQEFRMLGGLTGKYKDPGSVQQAEQLIRDIVNRDHDELRVGDFLGGVHNALWFRKGKLIVVLNSSGEWITILNIDRGGVPISFFNKAQVIP